MDPKIRIVFFSALAALSLAAALYEHPLNYGASLGFLTLASGFICGLIPPFREYLAKEKGGFMDDGTGFFASFFLAAYGAVCACLTYGFDPGTFHRAALCAGGFGLCWAIYLAEYAQRAVLRHLR